MDEELALLSAADRPDDGRRRVLLLGGEPDRPRGVPDRRYPGPAQRALLPQLDEAA